MTPIRDAYQLAAASAVDLLRAPAVSASWSAPSALAEFSVGGLAGHLAAQILFLPRTIAESPTTGDPVPLLGHYDRVTWIDASVDADINVTIRNSGERAAANGPAALADETAAVVADLPRLLSAEPADRVVRPRAGPWLLTLDDFLITRMMEIAVHSDDLAYSVGIDAPALPVSVMHPVFDLLFVLSLRRHGTAAMLRALSRAERAPATITAF